MPKRKPPPLPPEVFECPESPGVAPELTDHFQMKWNGETLDIRGRNLKLISHIAKGQFGSVSLMKEPQTNMQWAVKRILESEHHQLPRHLEREVRTCLKGGTCEFLVVCYGVMRLEGDIWICMEPMDTSMDKFYQQCADLKTPIPNVVLGRIAYSVLSGLKFLVDTLKIMHRDVKPTNILLNSEGRVKLCDYGVSGALESQDPTLTVKAGCEPYMAPERLDFENPNFKKYDDRSDVWSFGISLYEMAVWQHPYSHWKGPFQKLKEVRERDPPRLKETDNRFSPQFRDFVHACLIKQFENRPRYAELVQSEFIQDYLRKSSHQTQSTLSLPQSPIDSTDIDWVFVDGVKDVPQPEQCNASHSFNGLERSPSGIFRRLRSYKSVGNGASLNLPSTSNSTEGETVLPDLDSTPKPSRRQVSCPVEKNGSGDGPRIANRQDEEVLRFVNKILTALKTAKTKYRPGDDLSHFSSSVSFLKRS